LPVRFRCFRVGMQRHDIILSCG